MTFSVQMHMHACILTHGDDSIVVVVVVLVTAIVRVKCDRLCHYARGAMRTCAGAYMYMMIAHIVILVQLRGVPIDIAAQSRRGVCSSAIWLDGDGHFII